VKGRGENGRNIGLFLEYRDTCSLLPQIQRTISRHRMSEKISGIPLTAFRLQQCCTQRSTGYYETPHAEHAVKTYTWFIGKSVAFSSLFLLLLLLVKPPTRRRSTVGDAYLRRPRNSTDTRVTQALVLLFSLDLHGWDGRTRREHSHVLCKRDEIHSVLISITKIPLVVAIRPRHLAWSRRTRTSLPPNLTLRVL